MFLDNVTNMQHPYLRKEELKYCVLRFNGTGPQATHRKVKPKKKKKKRTKEDINRFYQIDRQIITSIGSLIYHY